MLLYPIIMRNVMLHLSKDIIVILIVCRCIVAFFVLLVIAATLLDGCKKLLEELRKTEDSDELSDGVQMGSQQVKDKLPSTLDTPGSL